MSAVQNIPSKLFHYNNQNSVNVNLRKLNQLLNYAILPSFGTKTNKKHVIPRDNENYHEALTGNMSTEDNINLRSGRESKIAAASELSSLACSFLYPDSISACFLEGAGVED